MIDPENIVVAAGAKTCFDLIAHSLAEPDDYFMCLAPYYYGTPPDIGSRGQVKCWTVQPHDQESGKFEVSIAHLDKEYQRASQEGVNGSVSFRK